MFARLAAPFIIRGADTKIGTLRLAFDAEADGLLDTASKLHCIIIINLDSNQVDEYGRGQISAALAHLARADVLIGHNIQDFDLPLLEQLHSWRPKPGCTVLDTLIAARTILPHINDLDDKAAAMGGPPLGKLRGRHSIEAWGVRLGMAKVGTDITDFSMWTPELQERCVGDTLICKMLWQLLSPDSYAKGAVELEHRTAAICNRITDDGIPFDAIAAEALREKWTVRRSELEAQLSQQFPGTNLNSRVQLGALLKARGWVPEKLTKKTQQPVINDEVLETAPALYPEFTGLAEHYTLGRRLAQLHHGEAAWLKHVGEDGRIHGGVIHIGTPHSRAAHFSPNLAQVPSPKRGKPLAIECRALFHHPGNWVFVACDQAGLQDRCFSHYLAAFDGGEYGRSFVAGVDTHWKSAIALELVPANTERDKANKLHTALREGSKSFRYGFLFGMRAKRAGEILATIIRTARQIDPSYRGPSTNGAQALRRFEAATPGLKQLRESLEAQAGRNGWLPGLDGRRVPTGAQYKALNRIVTAAEAIVCKRWLINVHDELRARFRYGWDGDAVIVAWIHDELVVCCKPEISAQVGAIMVQHAKEPGEFYGLKVPLDAAYEIGCGWAGNPPGEQHAELNDDHIELTATVEPKQAAITTASTPKVNGHAAPAILPVTALVIPQEEEPETLEQRLARIPLVELIDEQPVNGKIACVFHDGDDTPSLHIFHDHYHCFGCGAHGGHLDWLREAEGLSPDAAIDVIFHWQGRTTSPRQDNDERTLKLALAAGGTADRRHVGGTLPRRGPRHRRRRFAGRRAAPLPSEVHIRNRPTAAVPDRALSGRRE